MNSQMCYGIMHESKNQYWITPFSLTYGHEAVIPAEIGIPSHRMAKIATRDNNHNHRFNLDILDEKRENATINEALYKQKMEKYYN